MPPFVTQPPEQRVGLLGDGEEPDLGVDDDDALGTGDHRIEIEFGYLCYVGG